MESPSSLVFAGQLLSVCFDGGFDLLAQGAVDLAMAGEDFHLERLKNIPIDADVSETH
jgi:hypothetical protein